MKKLDISLHDSCFAHAHLAGNGDFYLESKYMRWQREKDFDVHLFTDYEYPKVASIPNEKKKIAWLLEPQETNLHAYQFIENFHDKFDVVLSHDSVLLEEIDNGFFMPFGGCWIYPQHRKIYPKSKNISMIASDKKRTEGHKLRHEIINLFYSEIDNVCGRGYNPVDYKLDALAQHRFSIVVESSKKDYYFTEKLIDCFVTGTIPIYWGCPSIGNFFDDEGIIQFDTIDELENILINTDLERFYKEHMNAIIDNFYTAMRYTIVEDNMYLSFFKEFLNI